MPIPRRGQNRIQEKKALQVCHRDSRPAQTREFEVHLQGYHLSKKKKRKKQMCRTWEFMCGSRWGAYIYLVCTSDCSPQTTTGCFASPLRVLPALVLKFHPIGWWQSARDNMYTRTQLQALSTTREEHKQKTYCELSRQTIWKHFTQLCFEHVWIEIAVPSDAHGVVHDQRFYGKLHKTYT